MSAAYRIGIVGLGHMGKRYCEALQASPRWRLAWVCDRQPEALHWAQEHAPEAQRTTDAAALMQDSSLDAIVLCTLADVRPRLLRAALEAGKHVIAEKPIAASLDDEWRLLEQIEASDRLVAVNMFNRSAWYHHAIQDFIARGEIGDLAIIRVMHETPGLMPTEGHGPEGPPFHDCGMHYVDVARWYAGSEYDRWHAQGVRLWGWQDPWWVTAHGSFKNGVVFQITNGFMYGPLSKDKTQHCGLEALGTLGAVRMTHDFCEATIEYYGVETTARQTGAYGGKKLDVLCETFAQSLDAGRNLGFPIARDSVIASQVAQEMLNFASAHTPPVRGTPEQMQRILEHRAALRSQPGDVHPSILI
jgi:myo-inositol 2-dehydrogenase/D-chiro-inositol 1-dehydrogenase